MVRTSPHDTLLQQLLRAPGGLRAPDLLRTLKPRVSQPTLWRMLDTLRAEGRIISEGRGRATRYHAAEGLDLPGLRSLRLHQYVARRLARDPALREHARARLRTLRRVNLHGRVYHDRWQDLIDGPLPGLLRVMTEDSDQAAALRQESPFTTLIPAAERRRVFAMTRAA